MLIQTISLSRLVSGCTLIELHAEGHYTRDSCEIDDDMSQVAEHYTEPAQGSLESDVTMSSAETPSNLDVGDALITVIRMKSVGSASDCDCATIENHPKKESVGGGDGQYYDNNDS